MVGHAANAVREHVAVEVTPDIVAGDAAEVSRRRWPCAHRYSRVVAIRSLDRIAVLDVIAAARIGMAEQAGLAASARRHSSPTLRATACKSTVGSGGRPALSAALLGVRASLVVAGKAVNQLGITEVVALALACSQNRYGTACSGPSLLGTATQKLLMMSFLP
jgi:hypothetical protein